MINLNNYVFRDPFIDEKDDRTVAELQEDLLRYANALSDLVRTEDVDVIQHVAEVYLKRNDVRILTSAHSN